MKTGILAGLAGVMVSGLVWAQAPERGPSERREGPPKRGVVPERRDFFSDMLRRSDTDKSGSISFEEFAKGGRVSELPPEVQLQLFKRLDKDGDGQIRRDEVPKPKGWGRGGPDRGPMSRGPHDPNRDGRVSLEEFRKSPRIARLDPVRQEEIFAKMDRNGDGFLDRKDHMGRHPGHEGNGRGPRGAVFPSRLVQELDADKDGAVSFDEFLKSPRMRDVGEDRAEDMFENMDRNSDGKLSPEDFKGERRGPGIGPNGPGKGPGGTGKGRGKPARDWRAPEADPDRDGPGMKKDRPGPHPKDGAPPRG